LTLGLIGTLVHLVGTGISSVIRTCRRPCRFSLDDSKTPSSAPPLGLCSAVRKGMADDSPRMDYMITPVGPAKTTGRNARLTMKKRSGLFVYYSAALLLQCLSGCFGTTGNRYDAWS
jgi:hypothetical protein